MSTFTASSTNPFRVGFLLLDGFSLLTYSSAVEPLRAANVLAEQNLYEIWNIPAQGARARASCGALIPANAHVGERVGFDLVLVVASNDTDDAKQPRLLDWLRQLARRKIIIGGLSAGPLMLARAGLLRERSMTLHWLFRNALTEVQPELTVERQLFVIDRDRVTCAGGTAPVDLMHSILSIHHGRDFAHQVTDWFSHSNVRSAESPQRAGRQSRYRVSSRQLNRLFQQHLGFGTMEFYRRLRLQRGYQLLTQSTLSIAHIGTSTGFINSAHFSRSFKRMYDKTPSEARWPFSYSQSTSAPLQDGRSSAAELARYRVGGWHLQFVDVAACV